MPFTVIKGTFAPQFGRPDGDSVRFVPDDPGPIFRLLRRGRGPKINATNGSIQLRYEAIDTMETGAGPLAQAATDANLDLVQENDGRGYICSNQLGPNGRPIAFVFSGDTDDEDGSDIWLTPEDIRSSVNVKQLEEGHAYPLYYDTLYNDLREECTASMQDAKSAGLGVWAQDRTLAGAEWDDDVDALAPIFPKLWRRIDRFVRDDTFFEPGENFSNFLPWMEHLREERVTIPSKGIFTGFDDLVAVDGASSEFVKLLYEPHEIVIVSV